MTDHDEEQIKNEKTRSIIQSSDETIDHHSSTTPLIERSPSENILKSVSSNTTKATENRKPRPKPLMLSVQNLPSEILTTPSSSANLSSILKRKNDHIDSSISSSLGHHNITFASQPYFFQSPLILSSPNSQGKRIQKFFSDTSLPNDLISSGDNLNNKNFSNTAIQSSSSPLPGGLFSTAQSSSTVFYDNEFLSIPENDEDDTQKKSIRNRNYYIRRASKAFWKSTKSLLGETGQAPASTTTTFYRVKVALYQFLEYPTTWYAYFYHFVISMIILAGLIFYILSTTNNEEVWSTIAMRATDITIATILVFEYFLRLWASSCIRRYQGLFGKVRFVFLSPFRIIDLILIAIAGLTIWASWEPKYRYNIYWLRVGHLFQILRLETRFKTLRVITEVIQELKSQLWLTAYMCFLSLLTISSVVYFVEVADENSPITNIPMALWWGIVTCFGIGYGDVTPATTWGKSVAGFLVVPSCIIWAIPAGLIATGLALKVERQERKKIWIKRQEPSARLIQIGWRLYATNPFNTHLSATWNHFYYVDWKDTFENDKPQSSSFLDLRSVLEDQIWLKRPTSWLRLGRDSSTTSPNAPPSSANSSTLNPVKIVNAKKNALRAILIMKYYVAAKKFHISFKPTHLPDLIHQYNETQNELLNTVNKNNKVLGSLHRDMIRLEFVLKQFQNSQIIQQTQINRMENHFQNYLFYQLENDKSDDNDYDIEIKPTTSQNMKTKSKIIIDQSNRHLVKPFKELTSNKIHRTQSFQVSGSTKFSIFSYQDNNFKNIRARTF